MPSYQLINMPKHHLILCPYDLSSPFQFTLLKKRVETWCCYPPAHHSSKIAHEEDSAIPLSNPEATLRSTGPFGGNWSSLFLLFNSVGCVRHCSTDSPHTSGYSSCFLKLSLLNLPLNVAKTQDFPGSPVIKTLSFQRRGPGFDSWSGN